MDEPLDLLEARDRWLGEARAIMADIAHHRASRVWIALRVLMSLSDDEAERREAEELGCLLFGWARAA